MKTIINREEFLEKSNVTLNNILNSFEKFPVLKISEFSPEDTVLVFVDVNNGFGKFGPLSSDRCGDTIPYMVSICNQFKGFKKLFLCDMHPENSTEFSVHPPHCKKEDPESEIVPELQPFIDENATIIPKNNNNGFITNDYQKWQKENMHIKNYIVMGWVSDMCHINYTLTQKFFMNECNLESRVIVPLKGTDTFELEVTNHNADLMNVFAIYNMVCNGIEVVADIK